jgi:hypothetical protein
MRKSHKNDRKKLLPLRVIAKDSPYSAAYLSILVQRGKLKTEKVGRNYYTTKEWFRLYMKLHARDDKRELQSPVKRMVKRANDKSSLPPKRFSIFDFRFSNEMQNSKLPSTPPVLSADKSPQAKESSANIWTRIMDMLLVLMLALIGTAAVLMPADTEAAMQSENYVIYDSVMYNFDGPVISGVSCVPLDSSTLRIAWTTDQVADGFVIYDTDAGMLATHDQGLSAKTGIGQSVDVSGLSAGTTYYYRVRSTRVNGGVTTDQTVRNCATEALAATSTPEVVQQVVSGGGGVLIIDKQDKFPPNLSDVKIESITAETAVMSWKSDEDGTTFAEYGADKTYGDTVGSWAYGLTHKLTIKNLKPGTAYRVRAVSSDPNGNIGYSGDFGFKTLPGEAKTAEEIKIQDKLAEIAKTEGPAAASKTLDLLGQLAKKMSLADIEQNILKQFQAIGQIAVPVSAPLIIGDPQIKAEAKKAVVSWRTDKPANSLVALADQANYKPVAREPYQQVVGDSETETALHEVTLYGLTPNTEYHIQLRSKTGIGPTARSRDYTFRTLSESLAISNYYVQVIDPRTASFKWVTNADADSAVRFTPYRGDKLAVDESKTVRDNALSVIHDIKISEFAEGGKYAIELSSRDALGRTAKADIPLFSTSDKDNPPEISRIQTNSTVFLDKNSKIQTIISWLTNEPATSQVFYREGVIDVDPANSEKTDAVEDYSKEHVLVITAFKPGAVYSFRVESVDAGGNKVDSDVHTFMTPKKRESILDMILRIFEDMFGWVKNIY